MSQCIYCRTATSNATGVAHVFPEAVIKNDFTLPRGAVCDRCNQYLGHELDATIVQYPAVAIYVQFAGLPGKSGSPRELIGGISLTQLESGLSDLRMLASECKVQANADGRRIARWIVSPTPAFEMRRFRRGLHHIALNAVAFRNGATYALSARFDPIRNYVRRPQRTEAWAFGEGTIDPTEAPRIGVIWPREGDESLAEINAGFTTFVVALDPRRDFSAAAAASGLQFIDESIRVPHPAGLTYVESEPPTHISHAPSGR
jgi:hypothetical protein